MDAFIWCGIDGKFDHDVKVFDSYQGDGLDVFTWFGNGWKVYHDM